MQIFLVSPCSSPVCHAAPAGVEAVVYALAVKFAEKGHQTHVVGVHGCRLPDGVQLHESSHEGLPGVLARLMMDFPHAVFCDHSGVCFDEGSGAERFFRIFHVAPMYVYAPDESTRCAFVSAFLRDEFVRCRGFEFSNCRVLHNGILLSEGGGSFEAVQRSEEVVYIGRMNRLKGIDLAAEACRRVGRRLKIVGGLGRGVPSDIVFHDLDFLSELECRFGDVIEYVGPLWEHQEKMALLSGVGALIIPSREPESCSLVALEAASVGTPVVAFRHGGIVEYVPECIAFADFGDSDGELVDGLCRALMSLEGGGSRADVFPVRFGAGQMCLRHLSWLEELR